MGRFVNLIALVLLAMSTTVQAARFDFETTPGRLPKDVTPAHYKLELELDPDKTVFSGRAEIDLVVRRPVAAIVLQAAALSAKSATLTSEAGIAREITVTPEPDNSVWRLSWNSRDLLTPGTWRLRIDYQGTVERRGQGLFQVEYRTASDTAQRHMLATQFQPAHARTVFPAFDEPAFRATFDIVITAPSTYEAVSNMPVKAQAVLSDGRRRTEFSRTPSMPTYLVALAVGNFDAINDSHDGIALRILTAPGRSHEARYAMEVTKQVLTYFKEYFGVPYMLPKLDQLAIPGVRSAGSAMEDWGAISYNETLLLFDPKRSAPRRQQTIFSVIAHEIAHQWFGNLVTAAWWDDIWLNEAFATWMAAKAQHHFNPAWGVDVRERLHREKALQLDAGSATRAVADPPPHETAIYDVFDDITYQKGGAVLGMFEAQLGEDTFRDGLRSYLKTHGYSNATADDLWFHLSNAAGRNIAPMIGDWVRQRGFPLLKVNTVCRGSRTQVNLSQQRFTSQRGQQRDGTWQVPVVIRAGEQPKRLLLGREPQTLEFAGCAPIVANGSDIGYYRVQYDARNMARLRAHYSRLPPTERIGLVADSMALARSGRIDFNQHFQLLEAVRDERDGAVWEQVIEGLTYLDDALAGTPAQSAVRAYGRSLLQPQVRRLGWQPKANDDAGTLRTRNALIDALGQFDDAQTAQRAVAMFTGATATPPVPIDPSIRAGVIRTAARAADAKTFETLRQLLREATNQEDNHLYGDAMLLVRDPRFVQRILELSLTDEWPPGSAARYARLVGVKSGHVRIGSDFVVRNFDVLSKKASAWAKLWVLPDAYSGFNVATEADELLKVQRHALGENAMEPAKQTAEAIREKAAVRQREEQRLTHLLQTLAHRTGSR